MMTSRLTLLTIFLFTFNLQNIHAQDLDTVTIAGRVMDQNGAVVPGAEIQAKLTRTGLTRTTTSDANGNYVFSNLLPSSYDLKIEAASGPFGPVGARRV